MQCVGSTKRLVTKVTPIAPTTSIATVPKSGVHTHKETRMLSFWACLQIDSTPIPKQGALNQTEERAAEERTKTCLPSCFCTPVNRLFKKKKTTPKNKTRRRNPKASTPPRGGRRRSAPARPGGTSRRAPARSRPARRPVERQAELGRS